MTLTAKPGNDVVTVVPDLTRHPIAADIADGRYPVTPDEVRHLVSAEDKLHRAFLDLAEPVEFGGFVAQIVDDLAVGADLPDDFAEQAYASVRAREAAHAGSVALNQATETLRYRWTRVLDRHVDVMLDGLRDQLDPLLDDIRDASSRLEGLSPIEPDAMADAAADQLAAVRDLRDLRKRYRELRRLQTGLVSQAFQPPGSEWEVYRLTWAKVYAVHLHEYANAIAMPPVDRGLHAATLWYVDVAARADVWVPTRDQLLDACETLVRRVGPGATQSATEPSASELLTVGGAR